MGIGFIVNKMALQIPECQDLSLEGIRKILFSLNKTLVDLNRKQDLFQVEIKEELKQRPTFMEVLENFSIKQGQTGVNSCIIQNIMSSFAVSVEKNIEEFKKSAEKEQETLHLLIDKAHDCMKISHERHQIAVKYSKRNMNYVYTHLIKMFKINRLKKIFHIWKTEAKNYKIGLSKLNHLQRNKHKISVLKTFSRWTRITGRIGLSTVIKNTQKNNETCAENTEIVKSLSLE